MLSCFLKQMSLAEVLEAEGPRFPLPGQGLVCVFVGQGSAALLCVGLCCAHHTLAVQSPGLFSLLSHRGLFPLINIPAQLLILPCLFPKICATGNDESQGPHLVIPRPCGQPVALCCWRPDAVQLSSLISWSALW